MAATETATKLKDDVSSLMDSYNKLLQMCYDALAPEATQRTRNEMRAALKPYLEGRNDGMAKPDAGS